MPEINTALVQAFTEKARMVAATVVEKASIAEALDYVVQICKAKKPCELLAQENVEKGPNGPNGVPTRVTKIIAAPDLAQDDFDALKALAEKEGFACINSGVRKHLAGIDVGVSFAELGVAASGTCMCNTDKEDVRLAGMISEIHAVLVKKSTIYPDLPSIVQLLRKRMNSQPGTFTTLITGPSRTADIERVSAIGVHGPLELHIILLEA